MPTQILLDAPQYNYLNDGRGWFGHVNEQAGGLLIGCGVSESPCDVVTCVVDTRG